jgi:hypothetical protein
VHNQFEGLRGAGLFLRVGHICIWPLTPVPPRARRSWSQGTRTWARSWSTRSLIAAMSANLAHHMRGRPPAVRGSVPP